jgi:Ran GTPase-activating protein (RanGAP) involved in mRNA processing and transport
LNLQKNGIEDGSALKIAEGLKKNHTLCSLQLIGNKISNESIGKILEATKDSVTLSTIDISNSYLLHNRAKRGTRRNYKYCKRSQRQ